MQFKNTIFLFLLVLCVWCISSCQKTDITAPIIQLKADSIDAYALFEPFVEPGFDAFDNKSCNLAQTVSITNLINNEAYGNYKVLYEVVDEAGNKTQAERPIKVALNPDNYYDVTYQAVDSCTSGTYFYTGSIQDCGCAMNIVLVSNISNFGSSASFFLPLSGNFNEQLTLDTAKAAVYFSGTAIMSENAQQLNWSYSISDSVSSDFCKSVWLKE